ncbi:MAG: hypothetical protein LW720_05950, partial [Pirellula sp.]|nr:hypothetical protein [Pirellula sp.]
MIDIDQIRERLGMVESLVGNTKLRSALREALRDVYDLERLLARVATGRCSPRDLQQVGRSLLQIPRIQAIVGELDCLASLAELAVKNSYVCPTLTQEPILEICEGRHPVLDSIMAKGKFVPNDCMIGSEHGRIQLITGPNMAGKSTYIRQCATILVLAQIGSFVPARKATIGIADKLFARVGASEELSKG